VHFVAGPWFTVQNVEDQWQELSHIWISNGQNDWEGKVEIKVSFVRPDEADAAANKLVSQTP
jgi:hypothetical protein